MITLNNITKGFGTETVIEDFSMVMEKGRTTVFIGPSGCGKTTLLRIICGLESADSGTVTIGTPELPGPSIRVVFQEDRLIPWATLLENLLLAVPAPLRTSGSIRDKAMELVKITGLKGAEEKYPGELSGGMRKRAALARGFISGADILLLDEPLQAVDWALKLALVDTFRTIQRTNPVTAVFVTHDIQEAALMGDTLHVLDDKPMRLRKSIINKVPDDQRSLYNEGVVSLEKELFELLTGPESIS